MVSFSKTIAVVTGGGSGLGRALCLELSARGAVVYAADIDEPGAAETARLASDERAADAPCGDAATGFVSCGDVRAVPLDVSDPSSIRALLDRVAAEQGRLDLMVNNAAVNVIGLTADIPLERAQEVLRVNLLGGMAGCTLALARMAEQGTGLIVNVASAAGLLAYPTTAAYTASKAGLIALSRSLRAEARHHGVRVTVACPGVVDTPIYGRQAVHGMDRAAYRRLLPSRAMDPRRAARIILSAAARGREIVVFPLTVRLACLLARYVPPAARLIRARAVRGFRAARRDG